MDMALQSADWLDGEAGAGGTNWNAKIAAAADALRQQHGEIDSLRAELAKIVAVLPGALYMDPPDGGDVTLAEQIRRMAADAERLRAENTHLRVEAMRWRQVAENCAVAQTKTESCAIYESSVHSPFFNTIRCDRLQNLNSQPVDFIEPKVGFVTSFRCHENYFSTAPCVCLIHAYNSSRRDKQPPRGSQP